MVGIGVYGRTDDSFVNELRLMKIRTVIDVRLFRGMRGPKYRWANSNSLQQLLKSVGIGYEHRKELAPPKELREIQKKADALSRTSKGARQVLHPDFVRAYGAVVQPLLTADYLNSLPRDAAFLCAESSDEACHRSVLLRLISERRSA